MTKKAFLFSCVTLILAAAVSMFAQASEDDRRANTPIEPFKIVQNVYYVGAAEVTSFLITSPKGHILIDSGYSLLDAAARHFWIGTISGKLLETQRIRRKRLR